MKHFTFNFKWLVMSLLLCIGSSAWGTGTTTQVTSATATDGGSYVIAIYYDGDYYAIPGASTITSSNTYQGVKLTLNALGKVNTSDATDITWTLYAGTTSGQFSIKSGTKYLIKSGTTGATNYKINTSTTAEYWDFTQQNNTYSTYQVESKKSGATKNLYLTNNSSTIGCYGSTSSYITLLEVGDVPQKTASNLTITNAENTINLAIGGTTTGAITYTTSSDGAMSFQSNNTSVATVNSTGTVTAVAKGSTTITVSQAEGTSYAASGNLTVTVNVSDPAVATTVTISDSGITNTDVYVSTTAGSFAAIVKDNTDATIDGATVTWSSSDPDVASIDPSTGAVTLVAKGNTTITASYVGVPSTYQESSKTYELTVTSSKPVIEETFTFSELGYSNGANVTTVNGDACILTFADGSNTQNSPKYYTTGTGARMYNGNILTISSSSKEIQSIEFTFDTGYTTLALATNQPGSLSDASDSKRTWTGSANSVEFTTTTTNRIKVIKVTYDTRATSDLTKTSDITLDFKDGNTMADLTEYFTSSSTGDYTYSVEDETIIENVDEIINALKEGTTSVTVSQAADATYKSGEITINVTVNDTRTACAFGIDLSSPKTLTKGDTDDFATTATKADGFTGELTYTYATSDASILEEATGSYSANGVGTVEVTIIASPTGGNAANYKPATQVVAVTVYGTNSINLDPTSKTVAFSTSTFDIEATVPTDNYDGIISAESSNTNVATVAVNGTTVSVTPVAVGTATISVTAGTGTYYLATAQAECSVEFTIPEGSTTAPSTEVTYTFDFTDNTDWEFPTDYATGENTYTKDGKTITLNTPDNNNGYKFMNSGVLLFGKEGATLTLPSFDKPVTKISTVGVSGSSGKVTQNIYVGTNAVSTETTSAQDNHEYVIDENYQTTGTIYTFKVTNANNTQLTSLTVYMYQAPTTNVTLNKYGYATYSSQYPIDFSKATGCTAWRVSAIDDSGNITFTKITETIKGGQGVLLYNKDADGVNSSNATLTFADGDVEFTSDENKLIGTTSPINVAAGEVYGLSGDKFVKSSAGGNIPAGKAYIRATSIPSTVKSLNFVFEDETTGISEMKTGILDNEAWYDLQGRKVAQPTKGIYIHNGKKVFVK